MEKHQLGNETIEVPDLVMAQGRLAVAEFVALPGTQRQERLNRLRAAHAAEQKAKRDAAATEATTRAEGLRDEQVTIQDGLQTSAPPAPPSAPPPPAEEEAEEEEEG